MILRLSRQAINFLVHRLYSVTDCCENSTSIHQAECTREWRKNIKVHQRTRKMKNVNDIDAPDVFSHFLFVFIDIEPRHSRVSGHRSLVHSLRNAATGIITSPHRETRRLLFIPQRHRSQRYVSTFFPFFNLLTFFLFQMTLIIHFFKIIIPQTLTIAADYFSSKKKAPEPEKKKIFTTFWNYFYISHYKVELSWSCHFYMKSKYASREIHQLRLNHDKNYFSLPPRNFLRKKNAIFISIFFGLAVSPRISRTRDPVQSPFFLELLFRLS